MAYRKTYRDQEENQSTQQLMDILKMKREWFQMEEDGLLGGDDPLEVEADQAAEQIVPGGGFLLSNFETNELELDDIDQVEDIDPVEKEKAYFLIVIPDEGMNLHDSNVYIFRKIFGVDEKTAERYLEEYPGKKNEDGELTWIRGFDGFTEKVIDSRSTHKSFGLDVDFLNEKGLQIDPETGEKYGKEERRAYFDALATGTPEEQELRKKLIRLTQKRYEQETGHTGKLDPKNPDHEKHIELWYDILDEIMVEMGIGPTPKLVRLPKEKQKLRVRIAELEEQLGPEYVEAFEREHITADEPTPYPDNLYEERLVKLLEKEVKEVQSRKDNIQWLVENGTVMKVIDSITVGPPLGVEITHEDLVTMDVVTRYKLLEILAEGPLTRGFLFGNGGETAVLILLRATPADQVEELAASLMSNEAQVLQGLVDRIGSDNLAEFMRIMTAFMFELYGPARFDTMLRSDTNFFIDIHGEIKHSEDAMITFPVRSDSGFAPASEAVLYDVYWDEVGTLIHVRYQRYILGTKVEYVEEEVVGPFEPIKLLFETSDNPFGVPADTEMIVPGLMLFHIEEQQLYKYSGEAIEIGLLVLGIGEVLGAANMFRKALGAIDLLIGTVTAVVNGNRQAISELEGGPEFLKQWDHFQAFVMYYGFARVVMEVPIMAYNVNRSWKNVRNKETLPDEAVDEIDDTIKQIDDEAKKKDIDNDNSANSGSIGKDKVPRNLESEELKDLIPTEDNAQADSYIEEMKETIQKNDPWEMQDLLAEPIYITTVNGKTYILQGHNRIRAFSELGKPLDVIELSTSKAKEMFKSKMEDILNNAFE